MRCSRAKGHLNKPVRYLVMRQHEGWSFATLTITAHQSPLTLCGFTGLSAPTAGCCCGSTVQCWRTAAALAEATCSPRAARWWRRMRRRHCCAFATPANRSTHHRPQIVAVAEKCSHIAQIGRFGESYSRRGRIIGSENGSGVDTRRWLMTELPQILSATNYAVAARGEAL